MYDGFWNRTAQNVVKGSVPVQSISVDMNSNRVTLWSYDSNGNATSIPGVGTITYDASNRVKTVGGETYEYDPSNKRTWKNDTFTFWGGRGERVGTYSVTLLSDTTGSPTQWKLAFVKQTEDWYFGGRRLNQVQDRLGSERSSNKSYYPYGEERSSTANPADKFATYHRDGTGLDYAQRRYYASGSGRFTNVDPAASSSNLYEYVGSDPVNAVDPGGLFTLFIGGFNAGDPDWAKPCQSAGDVVDQNQCVHSWAAGHFEGGDLSQVQTLAWSGFPTGQSFQMAYSRFIQATSSLTPGTPINVVGHSFGGYIALFITTMMAINLDPTTERRIDTLITLGTPMYFNAYFDPRNVGTFLNVYSKWDFVQKPVSALVATWLGWDFLTPGRTHQCAINIGIDSTPETGHVGHGDLHTTAVLKAMVDWLIRAGYGPRPQNATAGYCNWRTGPTSGGGGGGGIGIIVGPPLDLY